MPLLNYTTEIDPAKTVGEIQVYLAKCGATDVGVRYQGGAPDSVAFRAETAFGIREFVLPTDPQAVLMVLTKQQVPVKYRNIHHARKVAWRIVKDWVEAQMAFIQTEMVTIDQVMLPYMRTEPDGPTVYERYQGQQLALTEGTGS